MPLPEVPIFFVLSGRHSNSTSTVPTSRDVGFGLFDFVLFLDLFIS
jgi:hypothetical protein